MAKDERIKTALEKALERVEKLEVSEDKVQELEYLPEGAKLAAQYLKDEKFDVMAALSRYDSKVRQFVLKGVEATFLGNIRLPQNERDKEENKKALAGISLVKKSKARLNTIASSLEHLFLQYEQARRQIYQGVRGQFEANLRQAMQQQFGKAAKANINVESHPEFQQGWQMAKGQLDAQYGQALEDLKRELARLG